jgi:5-methyltetrahydropteroyltriglutamate--homocysteine methyltransferase
VHEPILTRSGSSALAPEFAACYAELAAVGLPINLVVPYDDVEEETYGWLVQLPVAAISLDFLGVPGADYGSHTAQLIAQHGFPQSKRLGAGVIDGRGAWADQGQALSLLCALRARLGADQRIAVQVSSIVAGFVVGCLGAVMLCRSVHFVAARGAMLRQPGLLAVLSPSHLHPPA